MTNIKRMLIAVAVALGLTAVAPTLAPVASATMSSCHKNLTTTGGGGAYSWCDNGDSNDRQRVVLDCAGYGRIYGPAKTVFYSSVAACPAGHSRTASGIQKCDNYYTSPTTSTCLSPGWYL